MRKPPGPTARRLKCREASRARPPWPASGRLSLLRFPLPLALQRFGNEHREVRVLLGPGLQGGVVGGVGDSLHSLFVGSQLADGIDQEEEKENAQNGPCFRRNEAKAHV